MGCLVMGCLMMGRLVMSSYTTEPSQFESVEVLAIVFLKHILYIPVLYLIAFNVCLSSIKVGKRNKEILNN